MKVFATLVSSARKEETLLAVDYDDDGDDKDKLGSRSQIRSQVKSQVKSQVRSKVRSGSGQVQVKTLKIGGGLY